MWNTHYKARHRRLIRLPDFARLQRRLRSGEWLQRRRNHQLAEGYARLSSAFRSSRCCGGQVGKRAADARHGAHSLILARCKLFSIARLVSSSQVDICSLFCLILFLLLRSSSSPPLPPSFRLVSPVLEPAAFVDVVMESDSVQDESMSVNDEGMNEESSIAVDTLSIDAAEHDEGE